MAHNNRYCVYMSVGFGAVANPTRLGHSPKGTTPAKALHTMARNLEVLVNIPANLAAMAERVVTHEGASPTVYHFARTVVRLHAKGMRVQRRYAKGVAKFFTDNIGLTHGGDLAMLRADASHTRNRYASTKVAAYARMCRNSIALHRAIRLKALGTYTAPATATAQLAQLLDVNAIRVDALSLSIPVHTTAAQFYRATTKLAKVKGGNYALWDQWHNAVTVNGFALNDQLVDDAIAHLRTMPLWSSLCRTVQAKFNLGFMHPVVLLGDEMACD